jgi:hypothetical protein
VKTVPSRLHWKSAPGSLVNVNVALELAVRPEGPLSMVVSAAAVSTVHEYVAGVLSRLPAGSVARTANVRGPSASPLYVFGEVHASYAAPSRLHW